MKCRWGGYLPHRFSTGGLSDLPDRYLFLRATACSYSWNCILLGSIGTFEVRARGSRKVSNDGGKSLGRIHRRVDRGRMF